MHPVRTPFPRRLACAALAIALLGPLPAAAQLSLPTRTDPLPQARADQGPRVTMSELRARRILAAEGYRYAGHDVCDDPADCYLPIEGVDPPQVPLLILHGQNPRGGLVTFFLTETPSVAPGTRTGVSRPGAELFAERRQTQVQATTSSAPSSSFANAEEFCNSVVDRETAFLNVPATIMTEIGCAGLHQVMNSFFQAQSLTVQVGGGPFTVTDTVAPSMPNICGGVRAVYDSFGGYARAHWMHSCLDNPAA